MRVNFDNIKDNEVKLSKSVKPGVGVFTIISGEEKVNKNDNAYIRFEFQNKDEQKFRQDFYINNNEGLGRVKELAKNANVELGDVDIATLITRFIGKEVGLIVDGEKEYSELEGKTIVVTRPRLKFAKFSFMPSALADHINAPIKIDESKLAAATSDLILEASSESPKNDLPF